MTLPTAGWKCWERGARHRWKIIRQKEKPIFVIRGQDHNWREMMCVGPFKPEVPSVQPVAATPVTPPSLDDPEVRTAANTIRKRGARSKGFQYTMLTGPAGDVSEANIGRTTLGGA